MFLEAFVTDWLWRKSQDNTTRKTSKTTKMPSRSSFAESFVLNSRPVHWRRQVVVAEAVQDTASLEQAAHCCHGIRSGLPEQQSGLIKPLLLRLKRLNNLNVSWRQEETGEFLFPAEENKQGRRPNQLIEAEYLKCVLKLLCFHLCTAA